VIVSLKEKRDRLLWPLFKGFPNFGVNFALFLLLRVAMEHELTR
jgi:hypothetical protein